MTITRVMIRPTDSGFQFAVNEMTNGNYKTIARQQFDSMPFDLIDWFTTYYPSIRIFIYSL